MPISTSSFGDERDAHLYNDYQRADGYERETLAFPGITLAQAEDFLKRLGGGVEEKLRRVEGIGWLAEIRACLIAASMSPSPRTTNCWTT
jgi:hypothetical protein